MKSIVSVIFILFLASSVCCSRSSTKPQALTLVLYSSDICGPCQELAEEMRQQGVTDKLKIEEGHCHYEIQIDHRDVGTFDEAVVGKMTDILPEEVLRADNKILAFDNYSDLQSIRQFIVNTLHVENLMPCS